MPNNYAYYIHKDGKVYLKRNGWTEYREVELKNFGKYLRVVPVKQSELNFRNKVGGKTF